MQITLFLITSVITSADEISLVTFTLEKSVCSRDQIQSRCVSRLYRLKKITYFWGRAKILNNFYYLLSFGCKYTRPDHLVYYAMVDLWIFQKLKGLLYSDLLPFVLETEMIPPCQEYKGNREDI